MSDQPEPTKVMVNGAAVALLTKMFDTLKDDLGEVEQRLTARIDERIHDHVMYHEEMAGRMLGVQSAFNDRIKGLEDFQDRTNDAEVVRAARWWLPHQVSAFIGRNGKLILALFGGAIGFLVGLSGNLEINLH